MVQASRPRPSTCGQQPEGFSLTMALPDDEDALWRCLTHAASMTERAGAEVELAKADPYLRAFVADWGRLPSDLGVIARSSDGELAGAAWLRLGQHDALHVAAEGCPELAIAVLPFARAQGLGTRLMQRLIELSRKRFQAIALSVRKENPALRFYERLGFVEIARMKNRVGGESVVMRLTLRDDRAHGEGTKEAEKPQK